jgi:hypothetical protein
MYDSLERLLAAIILVMCCSAVAEEKRADPAKTAFENGVSALREEDFLQALTAFETSYKLRPKPVVLYNIGMCQKALSKYTDAISSLRRLLDESKDALSSARREETIEALTELEKKVAHLKVESTAKDADIYIDGRHRGQMPVEGPIMLDPGVHVIEVRQKDHTLFQKEISLSMGETSVITLPPIGPVPESDSAPTEPKPPEDETDSASTSSSSSDIKASPGTDAPSDDNQSVSNIRKKRILLFALSATSLTLGAAGLVVGGVYTYQWNKDYDNILEVDSLCQKSWHANCMSNHDYYAERMTRDEALLISGFAVGGACLAAGAVLMVWWRKTAVKGSVAFMPTPGGISFLF